jgi:uncharacterized protein
MSHPVVHWEIAGHDGVALQRFYTQVFGWEMDTDNPEYALVEPTDGGIGGGILQTRPGIPSYVTIYVQVEHLDESLRRIKDLGGEIVVAPMPIPGIGAFALFNDPEPSNGVYSWVDSESAALTTNEASGSTQHDVGVEADGEVALGAPARTAARGCGTPSSAMRPQLRPRLRALADQPGSRYSVPPKPDLARKTSSRSSPNFISSRQQAWSDTTQSTSPATRAPTGPRSSSERSGGLTLPPMP